MTNEPLCLSEYGHGSFDLADSVARKLARSTRGILEVSPEPDGGQWKITATNYVGTLNAAGLQVLIRPKINLANLLVLLDLGHERGDAVVQVVGEPAQQLAIQRVEQRPVDEDAVVGDRQQ